MSSTQSPNPNNLVILGVLCLGAYYMMSRRAVAGGVYRPASGSVTPAQSIGLLDRSIGLVNNLVNRLGGSRTSSSAAPNVNTDYYTHPTQSQIYGTGATANRDDDPYLNGSVADAYASAGADGIAFNPPNGSAYDVANTQ